MSRSGSPRAEPTEPRRPGRGVAAAACVFAAATALAAGAGIWALADPHGPAAQLLPLSQPHAALAIERLKPGAGPADLDAAEAETRRGLALAPADSAAWVRLAYIDYWRHGRLTEASLADLRRSYEIAPIGPDASESRLAMGFELWDVMPADLREQMLNEVAAQRRRDRTRILAFAGGIRNPAGRLAIGMAIAASDSEDALKGWD